MDTHAQQILQTALTLSADDRVEIAESLLQSLDEETAAEIEAAWTEEIRRRIESIDKGEAKMMPWDDAIRSMRERLDGYIPIVLHPEARSANAAEPSSQPRLF